MNYMELMYTYMYTFSLYLYTVICYMYDGPSVHHIYFHAFDDCITIDKTTGT